MGKQGYGIGDLMAEEIKREEKEVSSSIADLANLYGDETQESVKRFKKDAERIQEMYPGDEFTTKDIVTDIVFFFVSVALAYGWMLLMLLIVSFVTLSYIHFEYSVMKIAASVFAAVIALVYIISKVRKYNGLSRAKNKEDK